MDPHTLGLAGAWTGNLWIGNTGKMYPGVSLLTEELAVAGCNQENVVKFTGTAKINAALPAMTTAA
jgi:hypothetical protein